MLKSDKENSSVSFPQKIQLRNFKCPCGKSYLSYPALFTHIKQKHDGKVIEKIMQAPGKIQKPSLNRKTSEKSAMTFYENLESKKQMENKNTKFGKMRENNSQQRNKNKIYWEQFSQLLQNLQSDVICNALQSSSWYQMESFASLEKFVNEKEKLNSKISENCLGNILAQFLQCVSLSSDQIHFEQILILFSCLLQYTSEQNQRIQLLSSDSVDLLVQHMNPFINESLSKFISQKQISNMWIFQKNNANKVFTCFFNWLKWKQYTNFCITFLQ